MRAALFEEYGGPEVVVTAQLPAPHAGAGCIRVRAAAAGVNPLDWKIRRGDLREVMPLPLPIVPGRDVAGVVDEIGEGVEGVALGDPVFGLGGATGTYAEHVVLSHWAPVPERWSMIEAAGAGLAAATALHALDALAPTAATTVLVGGAAGSVGAAAAAFARERGLRVIGTARASNHELLRGLGAEPIAYGPGLAKALAASEPGPDLRAIDTFGGAALADLVAVVTEASRVVSVTDPEGAERLGAQMAYGENDAVALALAARLGAAGRYTPRVAATFPLDGAAEAHALAERGGGGGKVVIEVA